MLLLPAGTFKWNYTTEAFSPATLFKFDILEASDERGQRGAKALEASQGYLSHPNCLIAVMGHSNVYIF